jgi:quercetin dioxygenase-like cupin family protein
MEDNFNFNYVGYFDISPIKDKLNEIGDNIWLEHTLRQSVFLAHKDTETVEFMWDIGSLNKIAKGKIHSNFYKFEIDTILNKLKPIYKKKYGDGEFLKVLLVKLKKNSKISAHVDNGNSLEICKRTHIGVITNPSVIFTVGGEVKHMKEGDIWEINNQKEHSVNNDSNMDRIHLIIDYLVNNISNIKINKS